MIIGDMGYTICEPYMTEKEKKTYIKFLKAKHKKLTEEKQMSKKPEARGFIRELVSINADGTETWSEKPFYMYPKEWQGLSEDEINKIQGGFCKGQYYVPDLIKAIEQKLKEKNT